MKLKNKNISLCNNLCKNLLFFLFVLILLFHGELHILIFKSFEAKYKKEVKQIIKAGIPDEKLVLKTFHKDIFENEFDNFKWTKKNEFRFKNEMYDIIKTEFKGDSVYFYCFHDLKESKLFKNLDQIVSKFFNEDKEKQNEFDNTLSSFNRFYSVNNASFSSISNSSNKLKFFSAQGTTLSGFYTNKFRPPNFIFIS